MSRALVIALAPGDGDVLAALREAGWTVALATAEPIADADSARDLRQAGIPVFDGTTAELETIVEDGGYGLVLCTAWEIAELYLPALRKLAPDAHVLVACAGLQLARGARGELGGEYGVEAAAELHVYGAADAVLAATPGDASLLDALLADELAATSLTDALDLARRRHGGRPQPAASRGSRELFELRRRRERCRAAAPAIRALAASLPGVERVLVLADGAPELLPPEDDRVAPFPPAAPSDSDEAIEQLEQEIRSGACHLLIPAVTADWLEAYPAFADHLRTLPSRDDGDCTIVTLAAAADEPEAAGAPQRAAAPARRQRLGRAPIRLVAFYLPQFHPVPENDAWWGTGFTEWTNVGRGRPLFPGHDQPKVPGELGFYDLRLPETREAQARLAADAGIEAFCYYHYWFHGDRLLETPFTEVLESGRPDFPFCLAWANEPWSRRWDGGDDDVLQPQRYSTEDDLAHIEALLPALADPRALTVDGKPVFLVYDVRALPDPARTADLWRRQVRKAGLKGIHLVGIEKRHDPGWNPTLSGFDATVRFQPQFTTLLGLPPVDVDGPEGLRVWDYEQAWTQLAKADPPAYRRYESVFTAWDNTPRRGGSGWVVQGSTPESYGRWLTQVGTDALAQPPQQRLVFVNAWNEWAEGAYLEPDRRHGRGYLDATRAALRRIANETEPEAEPEPEPVAIVVAEPEPAAVEPVEELPLGTEPRARAVAFYLPQFHPIAENDDWWGPGFTEWTNVVRAEPLYPGHYQPHIPSHLGFYDLRVPQVREAQAELARAFGIEAFCYWHYWFNGKRLLERPFEEVLASGEPDFPFCLAWANESWSRRWLGEARDVLIEQEYSPRDDTEHARWLAEAFADPRYLRVLGRPVFVVYRPRWLPDPRRTAETIKSESVRAGLPEPLVLGTTSWDGSDCRSFGLDGTIEFEPRLSVLGDPTGDDLNIHDYADARARMRAVRDFPAYPTIVVSWDNTARRGSRGTVLANATPEAFERGFRELVDSVQDRPFADRLVFVNAWNEWAEGNHLEPDQKDGLGYLEAVRRVIYARQPGLVIAGHEAYDQRSVAVATEGRGV